MMDVIADHQLVVVYPDWQTVPVRLRIGRPTPHPNGDWGCEVAADGLRTLPGPTTLLGVGSWHALMIAIRFLHAILTSEAEKGAVFHGEDGEHPITADEVFVRHEIT